jgi:hypothetical protein
MAWRGDPVPQSGTGWDGVAEPTDRHAYRQRLKLTCPGCAHPLGRVVFEDAYLAVRSRHDQDNARRDGAERNGAGQLITDPTRRDPYALIELCDVGKSLAWRCPNTATRHDPRPMGLVPMREILALAETIRAAPGPATVTVAASRRDLAAAIACRAAGHMSADQLAAEIRDGVGQWARSWESDGPASWARTGHTVPDSWADNDPDQAQRHRDALAWADDHIGYNDKPTWWHDRDKATEGARLRADLAARFWPADPDQLRAGALLGEILAAVPRSADPGGQ